MCGLRTAPERRGAREVAGAGVTWAIKRRHCVCVGSESKSQRRNPACEFPSRCSALPPAPLAAAGLASALPLAPAFDFMFLLFCAMWELLLVVLADASLMWSCWGAIFSPGFSSSPLSRVASGRVESALSAARAGATLFGRSLPSAR